MSSAFLRPLVLSGILAGFLWGMPAFAQEPPAAPAESAAVSAPAPSPAVVPETGEPPQALKVERSIYLPFEDLEKVFEKEGRGVYLPYREFLDLWNQLNIQRKEEDTKPPVDGVIASADFKAALEGGEDKALAIQATLKVESFKEKGWAVIPLAKAGLNIAEAQTGEATLNLAADGSYQLIVPRKGSHEIKLKLYARLNTAGSRQSATLNLPRAGVSKFEAVLPEQGWDFEIQPAAAYSTEALPDGTTRFAFFFGESDRFDVAWQKQGEETKLTPLLFADMGLLSRVIPGAVQTTATVNYRVLRSGVDSFDLLIPAGQEVLGVSGQNIKEWDVQPPAGEVKEQRLTVRLHAAARQEYLLTVNLEQPLDALPMEFPVPVVRADKVVRQRGSVFVSRHDELDLEAVTVQGLTQQALAPAGNEAGAETPFGGYRYLAVPFELTLAVKKAEPQVEVESWTRYIVETDSARYVARFDYQIKRAGVFGVRIRLPQGFENAECEGALVEDFSEEEADGARHLNVKFSSRAVGRVQLELRARRTRVQAAEDETLPAFAPQEVARHEARLAVQVHTSLDANTRDTGAMRQMDAGELPEAKPQEAVPNQQVAPPPAGIPGEGPVTLAFRYRGEAAPAVLAFKLKEPQINAEVFTWVSVKDQSVRYQWTVAYQVQYAGVDTFIFSLPSAIASDLRVEGDLVKEVRKPYVFPPNAPGTAPSAGEGREFWAVMLRDKRMGAYELKLTLERPLGGSVAASPEAAGAADAPPAVEDARAFELDLPEIQLAQVFQENGQVSVVKDDNLEILSDSSTNLQAIDPKELDARLANLGGAIRAYKYRRHPLKLQLKVSRNEFLAVPSVVITYAALKCVVAPDRAVTTEAVYWVKNNTSQFISLRLPAEWRIVSDVLVDGTPQQPMRRESESDVLIRLPTGDKHRQTAFPVRFVYEAPSPEPGRKPGWAGTFHIPAVRVADADILQSQVQLYLPQDFVYRGFDSAMRLPVTERGWGRFRRLFDWIIPTLGPQVTTGQVAGFEAPPTVPGGATGGFDIQVPVDGRRYLLQRLDAPDDIAVSFQSQGFAYFTEALFLLLAFAGGLFLLKRPASWKMVYFGAAGLLPLIIGGAVNPGAASFWNAIFLGTLLAAFIWLVVGGWRRVWALARRIVGWFRRRSLPAVLGWIVGGLAFLTALAEGGFLPGAVVAGLLSGTAVWGLCLGVRWLWRKRRPASGGEPPSEGPPSTAGTGPVVA